MAAARLLCLVVSATCLFSHLATAQNGPTCDALDSIVANAQFMDCTRNDRCDTVDCAVTLSPLDGTILNLTILPCRDPPGVQVVAIDRSLGEVVVDDVYDQTVTGIDLSSDATLGVTLDQLDGAIEIEAILNDTVTLLPYTNVPLDLSSCTSVASTQDTTAIPTPTLQEITTIPHTTTLQLTYTTQDSAITLTATTQEICYTPMPTIEQSTQMSTPEVTATPKAVEPVGTPSSLLVNKTTCDVLAEFANSSEIFDCVASTKEPCDHVHCTTELIGIMFTGEVVLLPCHIPPAVQIAMSRDKKVVKNTTVDHSQEIFLPELFNLKMYVTLDHYEGAIGLQVDAKMPLQSTAPVTIFKYTIIPLYSCNKGDFQSANNAVLKATTAILTIISLLGVATGIV